MSTSLTPQEIALPLQIIDTTERKVKVLSASPAFVTQEIGVGTWLHNLSSL